MKVLPLALCASAALLSGVALQSAAQSYPAKAVRVVIPWPPGGSNDVVGRIVLQKMSESMVARSSQESGRLPFLTATTKWGTPR